MKNNKASGSLLGAGAICNSCFIVLHYPCFTLLSSSGIASTFSWIEPAGTYLIGLSIVVLAFAWYQKLKPVPQMIVVVQ